mmetsp:Transcript_14131/g.26569  ORF Transcript_14131/g.26569 Transcript_14131/m.26569 type:complete len:350 (-) Transcript_14131:1422-2471(-)
MLKGESYLDSYTCVKTLGSGQSASVFLLEDAAGKLFAGKVLFDSNPYFRDRNFGLLHHEAQILRALDSDRIVKLHGIQESGVFTKEGKAQSCAYLVIEYCEAGELYDYVHDSGRFSEELARFYFRELVKTVAASHAAGIAHCDIKLDNILLDSQYQVKLADFGLATTLGTYQNGNMEEYRGTPFYMAPEIHARKPYNGYYVDIFALGVCLFIMLTRTCPFKSASHTDDHYCLFLKDNTRYWRMYSQMTNLKISPALCNLINSLLALDPTHRLSLSEIMSHPWMQGPMPTDVVQQMTARKAAIERMKSDRNRLETEQRMMIQRQAQLNSQKHQKKTTDYNDLVDELVSKM